MLTLYCKGLTPKALGGILLWMIIEVASESETHAVAKKLGSLLRGGEVIELVGDVGAGKTTFVKAMAEGLLVDEDVQSPSFTISRLYEAHDDLRLAHYDFYNLTDAGIMKDELSETMQDPMTITVIEWGKIVEGILPQDRLTIQLESPTEMSRKLILTGNQKLLDLL